MPTGNIPKPILVTEIESSEPKQISTSTGTLFIFRANGVYDNQDFSDMPIKTKNVALAKRISQIEEAGEWKGMAFENTYEKKDGSQEVSFTPCEDKPKKTGFTSATSTPPKKSFGSQTQTTFKPASHSEGEENYTQKELECLLLHAMEWSKHYLKEIWLLNPKDAPETVQALTATYLIAAKKSGIKIKSLAESEKLPIEEDREDNGSEKEENAF